MKMIDRLSLAQRVEYGFAEEDCAASFCDQANECAGV